MCAVLVQDEFFTGYSLRNLSRSSNLFQKKAYRQFFDVRDRYQHSRKSQVTSQCLLTQFQQNTINRLFNERHVVEQINFRSVSFPSSIAPPFDLLTLDRFLFAQPWQLKFSHGLARYLIILRSEQFCICMNKQQISSPRDERRRLSQAIVDFPPRETIVSCLRMIHPSSRLRFLFARANIQQLQESQK